MNNMNTGMGMGGMGRGGFNNPQMNMMGGGFGGGMGGNFNNNNMMGGGFGGGMGGGFNNRGNMMGGGMRGGFQNNRGRGGMMMPNMGMGMGMGNMGNMGGMGAMGMGGMNMGESTCTAGVCSADRRQVALATMRKEDTSTQVSSEVLRGAMQQPEACHLAETLTEPRDLDRNRATVMVNIRTDFLGEGRSWESICFFFFLCDVCGLFIFKGVFCYREVGTFGEFFHFLRQRSNRSFKNRVPLLRCLPCDSGGEGSLGSTVVDINKRKKLLLCMRVYHVSVMLGMDVPIVMHNIRVAIKQGEIYSTSSTS